MTRDELAEELAGVGLSASQRARALALADEYAAALVQAHASSPRGLGIVPHPVRDTAGVRRWAVGAGLMPPSLPLVPARVIALYDEAHREPA